MRSQFDRQFSTPLRVRAFGEKHSDLFPSSSLSGRMFGTIAQAIPELSKTAGSQAAGLALAKEGVTAKAEAREALREWIVDKTLIARLALSPDGANLVITGTDGNVILFKLDLP